MEEAASERLKAFNMTHEVMKIIKLTCLLFNMPHLSSPRLKHGRRQAYLSMLNLSIFSFVLSLALLPPLLTSPTVPLPGSRLRSSPTA